MGGRMVGVAVEVGTAVSMVGADVSDGDGVAEGVMVDAAVSVAVAVGDCVLIAVAVAVADGVDTTVTVSVRAMTAQNPPVMV